MIDPQDEWCDDCHGHTHISDCPAFTRATAAAPLDAQAIWDKAQRDALTYAINLISHEIPVGSPQGKLPVAPHVKAVITALEKYMAHPMKEGWRNQLFDVATSPTQPETPLAKGAMFCEHANEVPARCPCKPDCYCKTHTCKHRAPEPPDPAADSVAREIAADFTSGSSTGEWASRLKQRIATALRAERERAYEEGFTACCESKG